MGKKILLADDSITIQKVVELTFSDSDFDVISVGNGEQALRKARELRPDIALLDVIMPEKNGYEVCQILKQDPDLRGIPILLLTGTFESFDRERAAAAGADGFLTKPFESQMLISKVEELLAAAPRQVTPSERAGRMEVVTEGQVMTVEAPPRPPEQPAASRGRPEPPPAPTPPQPADEAEEWMRTPEPEEVSFPGRRAEAAPEAREAFREWSSAADVLGGGEPAAEAPSPVEEERGGPPPASAGRADTPQRASPAPATGFPDRPLAPDTYEQTFEMQGEAETIALAAPRPESAPEGSTVYTGPDPTAAPELPAAVTPQMVEQIARRVMEKLSDQVIREVAWEVIPDLAELLIRQRIRELERGSKPND